MATICRETNDFSQAQREIESNPDHVVKVRGRSHEGMVLMSERHYESLQETLEILHDENLMQSIRRGLKQLERGETLSWDEAMEELGW